MFRVLFSNLGYARGIDGTWKSHIGRAHRHFYITPEAEKASMMQFREIVKEWHPDLCCMVEITKNQIAHLLDNEYSYFSILGKYGDKSILNRLPLFKEKCNGFIAKDHFEHEILYFEHGTKRLIYNLSLPNGVRLIFAHFSLSKKVRYKQFMQIRELAEKDNSPVIILGDFNILRGFDELQPLLEKDNLKLISQADKHTFTLGKKNWVLDLCICSASIASQMTLKVIPQPFSDHDALMVEWRHS